MGKKAFLIGKNTAGLQYAEDDVQKMKQALAAHGYYCHTASFVKKDLLSEFDEFIDKSQNSDTLIFYFSGHAFCPNGNLILVIEDDLSKRSSQLYLSDFLEGLKTSPAREKLIILDCCRAGAAIRDWIPEQPENYRLLTASDRLETAKELDNLRSSFLTYYFCKALTDNVGDVLFEKKIRINETHSWLIEKAEEHNGTHGSNKVPIPNLLGNAKANFLIGESAIEPNKAEVGVEASEDRMILLHHYSLPKKFIGRNNYVSQLIKIIRTRQDANNQKTNIVTITGIGGTGKSCLVRQVIEDIRYTSLPYKFVVWFSFAEAKGESKTYFFQSILQKIDPKYEAFRRGKLELKKNDIDKEINNRELCERLCEVMDHTAILLVIDNLELIQITADNESELHSGEFKKEFSEIVTLFNHVVDKDNSLIIITSRLDLGNRKNHRGYCDISMNSLESAESIELLESLGVKGQKDELIDLVETLGNHALCVKSAGIYLAKRNMSPAKFKSKFLPKAFKDSEEGQKMLTILDLYKEIITDSQEYFLKMASLHLRGIKKGNYPALVEDYQDTDEFIEYIEDEIIEPLINLDLLDKQTDIAGEVTYSSHPLMRFVYKTWVNAPLEQAYEQLAKAALADCEGIRIEQSVQDIQPYFDVIYYYLHAGKYEEAFDVIEENEETFSRFRTFKAVYKYLLQLEDNYRLKKFEPYDKVLFLDRLAHFANKDELTINYRKEALQEAKAGGKRALVEMANLLCGNYLDCGHLSDAEEIYANYISKSSFSTFSHSNPSMIKGRIEYLKGNFTGAIELFNKEYLLLLDKHDFCRATQKLAPMIIRVGDLKTAEEKVHEALNVALKKGFNCCVIPLYDNLCDIEIFKGNIRQAEEFEERKNVYANSRGMECSKHKELILKMGRFDDVINLCKSDISEGVVPAFNRLKEIRALLLTAHAYMGKGLAEKADAYYQRGKKRMNEHGLYSDSYLLAGLGL